MENVSAESSESPRVNILMVDDSPDKLLAMESALSSLGQNLVKAHSGEQALRLLLKGEFAVILLDVNMPGLDGFETAALIRQRKSLQKVPIIFVTALSTTDADIFKGYEFGAVDYILTPILPEILRTKVGVFVDLWQGQHELRKQAEALRLSNEKLAQRAEQLSQVNKELESFCYTIAHDLRAPLRAMEGLTGLLLEDHASHLGPEAREYGQRVRRAAIRMDQMIQELLEYSRLTLMELKPEPVPLAHVTEEAMAALGWRMDQVTAKLEIAPLKGVVQGHRRMLVQVLSNLLGNAVKFAAPGRDPVVQVGEECLGEYQRIFVRDNGIGIAPEHKDRIFRIFERLHDVEAYAGTGIGLAIVAKAVTRMRGRVGVESQVGKGSEFWFELPVCAMPVNGQPTRSPSRKGASRA